MFTNLLCATDSSTIIMIVVIAVMFVGLFIFNHFSNKKRQKAEQDKLSQLSVGDKVLTSCGIIGTIVRLDEISPVDMNMVIETGEGDNKSTLTFDIRALYQVLERVNKEPEIVDSFEQEVNAEDTAETAETKEDNE